MSLSIIQWAVIVWVAWIPIGWLIGMIIGAVWLWRNRPRPFTQKQQCRLDAVHAESTRLMADISRGMQHNPGHWARYGDGIRNNQTPMLIGLQNSEEAKAWNKP